MGTSFASLLKHVEHNQKDHNPHKGKSAAADEEEMSDLERLVSQPPKAGPPRPRYLSAQERLRRRERNRLQLLEDLREERISEKRGRDLLDAQDKRVASIGFTPEEFEAAALPASAHVLEEHPWLYGRYRSPEVLANSVTKTHFRMLEKTPFTFADIQDLEAYALVTEYRPAMLDDLIGKLENMGDMVGTHGADWVAALYQQQVGEKLVYKHADHNQKDHGNRYPRNASIFEDRSTGTFHLVGHETSSAKRGRECTLCGLDTSDMRKAAPFPSGDPRGAVHVERGCTNCINTMADVIDQDEYLTKIRKTLSAQIAKHDSETHSGTKTDQGVHTPDSGPVAANAGKESPRPASTTATATARPEATAPKGAAALYGDEASNYFHDLMESRELTDEQHSALGGYVADSTRINGALRSGRRPSPDKKVTAEWLRGEWEGNKTEDKYGPSAEVRVGEMGVSINEEGGEWFVVLFTEGDSWGAEHRSYWSKEQAFNAAAALLNDEDPDVAAWWSAAANIDSAMQPAGKDFTVYRGIEGVHLSGIKVGERFKDNGFLSTSTDRSIAQSFGNTLLRISGGPEVPVVPITFEGMAENEILLDNGVELEITGKSDGIIDARVVYWTGPDITVAKAMKSGTHKSVFPSNGDVRALFVERVAGSDIALEPVPAPAPPSDKAVDSFIAGVMETLFSRLDKIAKHMGPGDHPSGSPQTVHRGGMSVGTQPPLFGEPHPKTRTKLTFRSATEEDYGEVPMSKPAFTNDRFTEAQEAALRLAVEEFETAYPDALPPDLTFALYSDPYDDGTVAFAWNTKAVGEYGVNPSLVLVNTAEWEKVAPNALREASSPSFVATQVLRNPHPVAETAIHTRIVFHELAHVVENHLSLGEEDVRKIFPRYNGKWYKSTVDRSDPSIPSPYATTSRNEFFAEALSDNYYNGEDATPISRITASQLQRVLSGDIDEALNVVAEYNPYESGTT